MSQPTLSKTELSHAIGLARIVLIIGLVFLHYGNFPTSPTSPFQGVDVNEHSFITWLNSAVLFFFFSAVPLLSMISGWLFFSFAPDDAARSLKQRIRKRFMSLYVPLLVWNAAYLLGLYAVYTLNPSASFFATSSRITMNFATAGWTDYFNAVTGFGEIPIAFQFWFVRDLFVTILVTPVLYVALRFAPFLSAILFGAIWLYGYNMAIFFRPDVPFFFYLGALIRNQNIPLTVPKKMTIVLLVLYLLLVSLRALVPYVLDVEFYNAPLWLDALTRLMRIVGVIACWGVIYRSAQTSLGLRLSAYGGLAFFLHSAHWPLLAVVKVAVWKLTPSGHDVWLVIHWIVSVSATVAIGMAMGTLLAKLLPRVFAFMNGGRMLTQ